MDYRVLREDLKRQLAAHRTEVERLTSILDLLPENSVVATRVRAKREAYVPRILELLEKEGRPMTVAEMARALPARREALERAIWMDLHRTKGPRLKRVSKGLYWIAGKPVPKEKVA